MNLVLEKPEKKKYPRELPGMTGVAFDLDPLSIKLLGGCETETSAHSVLEKHPGLFREIKQTGHHGLWVSSKPQIRPTLTNGKKGKIPDFLLAGKGSDGLHWYIIELKSPSDCVFNAKGTAFSTKTNEGLTQLAMYLHYAKRCQTSIRDSLEIRDFENPKGILVIGKEDETLESEEKLNLKNFWNGCFIDIEIISYSRIIHATKKWLEYVGNI